MRLVLTGDSITAAGRDLADATDLGTGYAARVAAGLPDAEVVNTGVNGHRVPDLQERWERDVLAHEPDVVSLMVGVNDMWRRYTRQQVSPVARFEAGYRDLLTRTRAAGVDRIIVLEPFLLPVRDEQWSWRADLDEKIAAVRRLAREFDAELVATDGPMAQAGSLVGVDALVRDGVHPTAQGHDLLARHWLAAYRAR
ncbi:SGNH/GDSL hydrolase family protein [Nocardioides jensenii]|uniref:SGNH/GDSL hydrolase family protein n=1 Tax=Nocardioides jensenii TaxID=1843 RepID=UPI000A860A4A|nr:SGNH/GDSL hydrolase family protein [Nocardioides jensenii]